ncbi:MAG: hypothetical protein OHK0029_25900 [Armatimonadaceae bacterium]
MHDDLFPIPYDSPTDAGNGEIGSGAPLSSLLGSTWAVAPEIQQAEDLLCAVLESTTDAVYLKDATGRYAMINLAGAAIFGRRYDDILGKTDRELFLPLTAERIEQQDRFVLRTGQEIQGYREIIYSKETDPATPRVFLTSKKLLKDRTGNIVGILGYSRDVTEAEEPRKALIASENRYRTLFDSHPYPMWLYDPETLQFLEVNDAAVRQYGFTREEFLSMTLRDIRPKEQLEYLEQRVAESRNSPFPVPPHYALHRRKDGSPVDVEISSTLVTLPDGTTGRIALAIDISERVRVENERREIAGRFEQAFHGASIGMTMIDLGGQFLDVNASFCEITGYTAAELIGRPSGTMIFANDEKLVSEDWEKVCSGEMNPLHVERRFRRRNGDEGYGLVTAAVVRDATDNPVCVMVQLQDITERRKAEQRLRWQAYHDLLTGLANRFRFDEALSQALEWGKHPVYRDKFAAAVLLLDLDRFKRINDTLGHFWGDRVLQELAVRLESAVRPDNLLARMGGDEFIVLIVEEGAGALEQVSNKARETASRMIEALSAPIHIRGHELYVSGSVGISVFPNDGDDAETLLKHADVAMYRAKEGGRGTFQFYTRNMNAVSVMRLRLESALQRAIERDEMQLVYQPMLALKDKGAQWWISGAEALVRWKHPDYGVLLPGQFLPIAEETGLVLALDSWVLKTACRQLAQWHRAGKRMYCSINLSARQFSRPDILELVLEAGQAVGLPLEYLVLEITENALMQSDDVVKRRLWSLKEHGIKLAVDDFGTGYSSLSYLRTFPLDILKIDRSFVESLPEDGHSRAVIRTLLELASVLNMEVVAEGVEHAEQVQCLSDMGCSVLQGFAISRAVPFEEMLPFVQTYSPRSILPQR